MCYHRPHCEPLPCLRAPLSVELRPASSCHHVPCKKFKGRICRVGPLFTLSSDRAIAAPSPRHRRTIIKERARLAISPSTPQPSGQNKYLLMLLATDAEEGGADASEL